MTPTPPLPSKWTLRPCDGLLRGASAAGMVRALSGRPAAWRTSRRGSFLVLVVGTLALLAVITIVYVALGNQDSRTKAAVNERQKLDSVPRDVGEYFAQRVANDVLSRALDQDYSASSGVDVPPQVYREASDRPSIRFDVESNPGTNAARRARLKFNAEGSLLPTDNGQVQGGFNTVPPTDPYLASSEPAYLDHQLAGHTDPDRPYLDNLDWEFITNLAPDGAFVNLYNLRPTWAGGSGFNATPNQLRGIANPATGKWLYDDSGAPTQSTDWGDNAATAAAQNRPFFWTARQRKAARPAWVSPNEPSNQTWFSPSFRLYQWVDTDGDGILDSRIFELKDNVIGGGNQVAFKDVLTLPGPYRWFFGARCIDLSGRVNVNTATDLVSSPVGATATSELLRLGSSPSEVDLLRVLRLTDLVSDAELAGSLGGGTYPYGALVSSAASDPVAAYTQGTGAYFATRMALASGLVPALRSSDGATRFALNGVLPDPSGINSMQAFWASTLPGARDWRVSTYPQVPLGGPALNTTERRAALYAERSRLSNEIQSQLASGSFTSTLLGGFGVEDLAELLERDGINSPQVSMLERVMGGRDAGDALRSPLRSARTLEQEMGPFRRRYDIIAEPDTAAAAPGGERDTALLMMSYDPRRSLTTLSGARPLRSTHGTRVVNNDGITVIRANVDPYQLNAGELTLDLRSALETITTTTDQSLRNQQFSRIYGAYADALAPYSGLADDVWPDAASGTFFNEFSTLFYGHRGPEFALQTAAHMAVNLADMLDEDTRPTGASFALTRQAPVKNFLDTNSNGPTQNRLFPWWNAGNTFTQRRGKTGEPASPSAWGVRLTIENERLAPTIGQTVAPAMNVYGIEPQPFLTQVLTMTAYMDDVTNNGSTEAEIDGRIPALGDRFIENPDLLFRMVAFTITNPFDRDLTLTPEWLSDVITPGNVPVTSLPVTQPGTHLSVTQINAMARVDQMDDYHYLQWGNREYLLAQLERKSYAAAPTADPHWIGDPRLFIDTDAGNNDLVTLSPIRVRAGGSVVCYAISHSPREVLKRLKEHNSALASNIASVAPTERQAIEELLGYQLHNSGQFNAGQSPTFVWIPMIGADPTDAATHGRLLVPDELVYDPIPDNTPSALANRPGGGQTVNLWRSIRVGDEDDPTAPGATTFNLNSVNTWWGGVTTPAAPSFNVSQVTFRAPNERSNDQLVDRMRLTDAGSSGGDPLASFDIRLPSGGNRVTGSDTTLITGPDGAHYWLTGWAVCSRRNDTRAGTIPIDVIPAYCIEPKYYDPSNPWNIGDESIYNSLIAGGTLTDANFTASTAEGIGRESDEWIQLMSTAGGSDLLSPTQLRNPPELRSLVARRIDQSGFQNPTAALAASEQRNYDALYPKINSARPTTNTIGGVRTVDSMRLIDVLLPLGLGPMQTPYGPGNWGGTPYNNADPAQFSRRWTTLGEALAIALGYEDTSATLPAGYLDASLWYHPETLPPANPAGIAENEFVFDRGNLRLDAFAPFVDMDNNGLFTPDVDERPAGALPGAMAVLDQFHVTPTLPIASSTQRLSIEPGAGLRTMRPGLININTATRVALGALPLASPPDLGTTLGAAGVPAIIQNAENWWSGGPGTAFDPSTGVLSTPDQRYDLAATMLAYRDKRDVTARTITESFTSPLAGVPRRGWDQFVDRDDPAEWLRGDYTGINGLNDLVGFKGVGELLAVRERDPANPASPVYRTALVNIDAMGSDVSATNAPLQSSAPAIDTFARVPAPPSGSFRAANEFDEKLAIPGAMLGSVTTRSDVFALWFVVMGFQPSDIDAVQDLTDPLVPSVQRRFLMVIDRSNVTKLDQKPRIVLFKEVPL